MRFMPTPLGGKEATMKTPSFFAEHAMRITFTLALVAALCSVLLA
jgi:hypothetical protein